MILRFATARNANGYRKYINIDTDTKTYSRENYHWLCREDFTQISATDRKRIISNLEKEGYIEIDRI